MAYNYHKAVLADVEEKIREDLSDILEHFGTESLENIDREELKKQIKFDMFFDDSVTGNGSGSYFFDSYKSAEALVDNDKLIAEALDFFENEDNDLFGARDLNTSTEEYLDITVRSYEIFNCLDEAIDNVIKSPDKQVAEEEILVDTEYNSNDFPTAVNNALEDYLKENIADILEENEINTTLDYENFEPKIEADVLDKIAQGEIDLPSPSSREIMHNLEKAFNEDYAGYSPNTVQDYCTATDIENMVKDRYAENVAFRQVSNVFEEAYDSIVLPAIEQREEEQNMDRD